ncbi:MAG: flagellar regulator YcgR PilZN domain-containing protein [Burkholderiales bacterium]
MAFHFLRHMLGRRSAPAADVRPAPAAAEVAAVLHELVRTRAFVAVHPDGHATPSTTLLLAASEACLWLDAPPDAQARARLEEARRLHFAASLRGVKLTFATPGGEAVTVDGAPALRVACPTTIRRHQRREFFRAPVPRRHRLECVFPLPSAAAPVRMPVEDLSCGGVGIRHRALAPDFMAGWRYPGARLLLGAVPWLDVELEGVHLARTPGGQRPPLAGYRFVTLARADAQKLQHFMHVLQAEAGLPA